MHDRNTVAILGPSVRFLSGISYYTIRLSNALSEHLNVHTILFRHMLPKILFPGWKRVGTGLATIHFNQNVSVSELLDWYSIVSWFCAAKELRKADIVIFQWWTSSVSHIYLALQLLLRRSVPIIIEYHEVVDPLEQSILPLRAYSRIMGKVICTLADHYVVHSTADRDVIEKIYGIRQEKITIIPHGLYDQYPVLEKSAAREVLGLEEENVILFFGLLRPYKGVKYLVEAFNTLPPSLITSTRLMIVGEAWEDRESLSLVESSPWKEKISVVNRYVGDDEIPLYFSAADVLTLPYTRASQSGVAHIAMSYGLPIIATKVGGLEEGLHSYRGAFFIAPESVDELREQMIRCIARKVAFLPPEDRTWRTLSGKWASLVGTVLSRRQNHDGLTE